ncbi:MAG TPA: DUF992 domain-containing protein [Xanthobacteraceae bacterium]|nr:DUF992 domain-containing protein [Xanthobacteraceae bacterium]
MHRAIMGASMGALILAFAALSFSGERAQAQRVRAGVLNCDVSAGLGLIIGSQRTVNCLFTPDTPGPQEGYFGTITKFGLDLGATAGGSMVWAVYADTSRGYGFLAGDYAGASGEATIAVGLGANVLVGGSSRTVALQPVSLTGQVGLNLALGVANLSIRPSR